MSGAILVEAIVSGNGSDEGVGAQTSRATTGAGDAGIVDSPCRGWRFRSALWSGGGGEMEPYLRQVAIGSLRHADHHALTSAELPAFMSFSAVSPAQILGSLEAPNCFSLTIMTTCSFCDAGIMPNRLPLAPRRRATRD